MATFIGYSFSELAQVALVPIATDPGARALAASTNFGPFAPGDSIVVSSTASFHMVSGGQSVAATTTSPRFPAGVYKFTVPSGVTHVAMIDSSDGAGFGQAYKG